MTAVGYGVIGAAGFLLAIGAPPNDQRLITVAQHDPLRSARALRSADVSADGRFVAFQSWARLVLGDRDDLPDVYVLDRVTGRVTLESGGADPDTENTHPRISGDGRRVVFESRATHPEQLPRMDIALRDRAADTTRHLTAGTHRGSTFVWSRAPDISDDGRRVAFSSAATTLVAGLDMNGALEDVYVIDVESGAATRASVNGAGAQLATGTSILPSLNSDGSIVAFASTAPLDVNSPSEAATPLRQIYVRDLAARTTARVSRGLRGSNPDGDSSLPSISGDGRYVVFMSEASNLAADDGNRGSDVFVVDRDTATTTQVSRGADGASANGASSNAVVSADGRYVAFQSDAANLVCASHCPPLLEDINLLWDVFIWDRGSGRITRLSEDELGGWMEWSSGPAIDRSGHVVAFSSRHPMDAADRSQDSDLFVRPFVTPTALTTAKK